MANSDKLRDILAARGLLQPSFVEDWPDGIDSEDVGVVAADSMWTHYSWLNYQLNDRINVDDDEFWRGVPQLPTNWEGPVLGWLKDGTKVYAEPGSLTIRDDRNDGEDSFPDKFSERVLALPGLIAEHAPSNLVETYLINLAELLRFINPAQLPEETKEFIAEYGHSG